MPSIETKWIPAKALKAGDNIVLRLDPLLLMPVTGTRLVAGKVLVENPIHGETRATPEMKIRIQKHANTTSTQTTPTSGQ